MKKILIIISILFFSILLNAQNSKSFFILETFDAGIPDTWTVNNTGGGTLPGWHWAEYSERVPYFTNLVMINSNDNTPHVGETEGELITPTFDASSASSVIMEFDHRYNDYDSAPDADSAQIDVWDGTQWQNVVVYLEDHGSEDEPEHAVFDITEFKNSEMKIRFFYTDDWWDWYWCIDNITVSDPLTHDLGVTAVAPTHLYLGTKAQYYPNATIHNYGLETETNFSVEIVVNNGVSDIYTSVKTIDNANLLSNSEMTITMDELWSITETSDYSVTATVILANDEYPDNNVLTTECDITQVSYLNQAYCIVNAPTNTDYFSSIELSTGDYETIGEDIDMTFFPEASEFADGVLYRIRSGINIIYFVSQDGTETELGEITGTDNSIADITYDENTGVMYLVSNTLGLDASYLHILNMQTYELSEIGKINNGVIATIELANDGYIYGIDIADDNILKINKETANATIIGSVGFDANYDQSLSYDVTTEIMYASLFEYDPISFFGQNKFCTINLSSGEIKIIKDDYEFGYQLCAFSVLPSQPTYITSIKNNNLVKVYPNPVTDLLNIVSNNNIESISIINITGQEILQAKGNSTRMEISISNINSGIYFIIIKTGTGTYVEKLIIR